MKKYDCKGYVLLETIIITAFVAGVLIFLYIQFSKLDRSYTEYYNCNNSESLYALEDIRNYIISDMAIYTKIVSEVSSDSDYLDITDCDDFTEENYCLKMLELEKVELLIVTKNVFSISGMDIQDEGVKKFMKMIRNYGSETYRLVAKFEDDSYATIRFGS